MKYDNNKEAIFNRVPSDVKWTYKGSTCSNDIKINP